jgi:hypothetical protein
MYRSILHLPLLHRATIAIRVLFAAGVVALAAAGVLTLMPASKHAALSPPPRAAETACHMDLAALGRTLPFVPMSTHERLAAHRILRQAYTETDDEQCRKKGGYILERFYGRNLHGVKS